MEKVVRDTSAKSAILGQQLQPKAGETLFCN